MPKVWQRLIFCLILFVGVGCQTNLLKPLADPDDDPKLSLQGSPHDVREEVLRHVPPGTPVDNAKSTLEKQGFRCTYMRMKEDGVYLYAEPGETLKSEMDDPCGLILPYSTVDGVMDVQICTRPIAP